MLKLGRPRGNRVKGGGSRPKRGREDPTRGQGRRTQRCAQPRARLGVQALADPGAPDVAPESPRSQGHSGLQGPEG